LIHSRPNFSKDNTQQKNSIWNMFLRNLFLLNNSNSVRLKKKFVFIPALIIILIVFATSFQPDKQLKTNDSPFHVTLAQPSQYQNGVYSSMLILEKGNYMFTFVPNGDSPKELEIMLKGKSFEFSEIFNLKGQLHETGISEYYTWDYDGKKTFQLDTTQEVSIKINPNGNILGSVSVDIIRN